MLPPLDSEQIKRRIFQDSVRGGLLELLMGIYLFFISGALSNNGRGLPLPLFPLILVLLAFAYRALRKKYVDPRLGYAKLTPPEQQANVRLLLYFLVAAPLVLISILVYTGDISHPVRWYHWMPILPSIILAGEWIVMAQFSGLIRYYLYMVVTILSAVPFMLIPFAGKLDAISNHLLALAGFYFFAGLFVFFRFLRKYPMLAQELSDEKN